MKNLQKNFNNPVLNKRKIFFGLLFLVVLSFSLYMFFLGRTIFDLVDRKNAEDEIKLVMSNISELELEVLDYNNKVTLESAYNLGFVPNNDPKFVSRKKAAFVR